ncbi:MAG: malic enzyme-like NAD(P)-binding protein [Pseudomonadota bacterium]
MGPTTAGCRKAATSPAICRKPMVERTDKRGRAPPHDRHTNRCTGLTSGLPPLKWSSAMFRKTEETHGRPVIFALSKPTSLSGAAADAVYRWSESRAVFASGCPFKPVTPVRCAPRHD